ncbi:MAG: putative quinol monooxygenase [Planctomycetota bacterium]|jgi:quinol monooxygenase YgiN
MAGEKITVLATLKAKEDKAEEVKNECLALIEPTRAEAGCISYDFHRDSENENFFMFYENWTSKQALDEHIQTPHLQGFLAKAGELLDGPLEVKILRKLS